MMDLREFRSALRLLTQLDRDEVGLEGRDWQAFRTDPFRFLIRADDETAERIGTALTVRMPPVQTVIEGCIVHGDRPMSENRQGGDGRRHPCDAGGTPQMTSIAPAPEEIWVPVAGYEGLYEVSDMGRVRSLDRVLPHARLGKWRRRGIVLSASPVDGDGYLGVSLSKGGDQRCARVHHLVAEAFIGPRPFGLGVLHRDGKIPDNRATNLYYGTAQNNADDMIAHGNALCGDKNPSAKLTIEQVREIRSLAGAESHRAISERFGVSKTTIGHIIRGHIWGSVR
jgi:hypothetical protein